jgi:hypothetical protein
MRVRFVAKSRHAIGGLGWEVSNSCGAYLSISPIRSSGCSGRQQIPYRCQSRNQGLCASSSSCLLFAAERSLGSTVWSPAQRKCVLATRSRRWSVQRPLPISNRKVGRSIRAASPKTVAVRFVRCQLIRPRPPATGTHKSFFGGVPRA